MRRYALLAGAQAAVGAAAIFARYALHDAKPLAVSAARLSIAALVLLIIALVRRERAGAPVSRRTTWHLVFAGLFLAAHFATWIASLDYTSVALSTLLVATTPIWTSLYDAIAKRRAPAPGVFVALGLGGAGLGLVVGLGGAPAPLPGHGVLGAVLALTGAFAMAAYFVLVERVRHVISTRGIVTRTYGVGALALVLATTAAHQGLPPLGDYAAWAGIAGMALVSQLLGHTALNSALRFFSASTVAFSSLFEPVIAAILAFFLFREALPPWSLAGAALIFAAIAIAIRNDRRGNLQGDRKPSPS
ncbi:MAG: DMT family transporter [Candidatus Eremiobacteraeota bacterium]|nr:DMT family transporter [Candidatus Eremiobacteraeota bacterium]